MGVGHVEKAFSLMQSKTVEALEIDHEWFSTIEE